MAILEQLSYYFSFSFVRYAFVVGTVIALCSALLGVVLVLKRFSFIGDGLAHTAFGAMAIGTLLNLTDNTIFTMPVTVCCALILLRQSKNKKIASDALIALFSTGALAIGYLVLNVFSNSTNISGDVCSTLFGSTSILTLTKSQVITSLVSALLVLVFFVLCYNKIFAVTFDPIFAKAMGINTELYQTLIGVVTAVVIVLAMNLVGSLLITALLLFAPLSAMSVMKDFKKTVIYAGALGVLCSASGIIISILLSLPVGATIVLVNMAVFVVHLLIGAVRR